MHFRSRTMLITLERSYPISANKNNFKRTTFRITFFPLLLKLLFMTTLVLSLQEYIPLEHSKYPQKKKIR